jgi:small conductance mechanosensitive channel
LDSTIVNWIRSSLGALLTIALLIALLSFFGVETTTFAALLAGAGIAIGAAWSGLLSNFASGIFLIILRPFNVGDSVTIAGVSGKVRDIGLFGTTVDAADNVQTIVTNSRIFSETIQNFSANPYRRVELTARLDHTADHARAIEMLAEAIARIPNVREDPAPRIAILSFETSGPVLAVRPYCAHEH